MIEFPILGGAILDILGLQILHTYDVGYRVTWLFDHMISDLSGVWLIDHIGDSHRIIGRG